PLGTPPVDPYAAELRKRVRATVPARAETSSADAALVDRLLVAALIEARSCERFRLLSEGLKARGPADLQALYEELLAAEARHFRVFVDLAHRVAAPDSDWIEARLDQVAAVEAELCARLSGAPSIHG
ncbi:MAG TPA: tRNA isopentenyl-2-thiomethyl-A-37 hydroxylase MiaE, partial [Polyangiaceae bacterium]